MKIDILASVIANVIAVIVVLLIVVGISLYLYFAYKDNPCGDCAEAKRCKKVRKTQPKWVKEYHKCYAQSKRNVRYIFFDWNGTVLDDVDLSYELLIELCRIYHVKEISKEEYLKCFGFPVKTHYEKLGFDFNKINYDEVSRYFIRQYESRWRKETKIYKDFKKIVRKLKKDGYKIYILTASETSLLQSQMKKFHVTDLFDGFTASDNIHAHGKIDYGREYLVKKHLIPEKALLIGDTTYDNTVAKELNMQSMLISHGHNDEETLKTTGAVVVNDFKSMYEIIKKLS